jgi:hypothetical protein
VHACTDPPQAAACSPSTLCKRVLLEARYEWNSYWMISNGQSAVGCLDVLLRGICGHLEDVVQICGHAVLATAVIPG